MAILKCKMCGGDLNVTEGEKVVECEYCGSKQTLPKTDSDVIANLFNRANNLRLKCEFDKAQQIYEQIVEQDDGESEAHWGIILCKYGIEYVEDPMTKKRIPTCHRTSYEPITTDVDYIAAIDYSDELQQTIYESEARAIDRIQRDILEIVKNEKPFDVFICYKEADENGKRTLDSSIANDIYYQLTQEGYKVFYAAITLEDKLGQEYEPYIFAALNSAKVMLVIGTKPEYFTAIWVKNEWSRFMKLMKSDHSKLLIPCYRDMDAYELPEDFARLQAQDMSKIGFINDVVRGIKKVIKKEDTPAKTKVETTTINANISPLLKRAFMFLEDAEFEKADDFCEQVLNIDPECAEAYLGKLMAELHVDKQENLKNCAIPFDNSNNYKKACRFDSKLAEKLNEDFKYVVYSNAQRAMQSAQSEIELKEAADLFKSIKGYKDSETLAEACLEKAEVERLEAERKADGNRVARKNTLKKLKKGFAIGTTIACTAIVALIVITKVIIPNIKYNDAVSLMESGQYEEAISAFEIMDGYKDSTAQIDNCKTAIKDNQYNAAVELMDSGDYVVAYESLVALEGYKDSAIKASDIFDQYKTEKMKIAEIGDLIYFGAYEQDNNTSNGKEDIEWRVLAKEENRVLVISEKALDCQQYNTSYTNVTWESCSLRKWLNGTFMNNAFSTEEQTQIQNTTVSADKNPKYDTNPGNATNDKVFLLSITEAEEYFTSDEDRKCLPTKYASAHGARAIISYTKDDAVTCWWWLRSPGNDKEYAASVDCGGSFYNGLVDFDNVCIRPALWINLDS